MQARERTREVGERVESMRIRQFVPPARVDQERCDTRRSRADVIGEMGVADENGGRCRYL